MPAYCYNHEETKKLITEVFPSDNIPEEIERDGVIFKRCRPAEWAGQGGMQPSTWPMISRALAVHSSQREEYTNFAAKHGVPTDFDKGGHPVFRDREHRKNYAKLVGAVDYEGGYGDHTG